MKKIKTLFLIAAIAVLFNSCAKDGATGPAGAQGAPGNANVNTYTFTTTTSSWFQDTNGGWYCICQNTSMNLNGGVEVYALDNTNSDWVALPSSGSNLSLTFELQINGDAVWIYLDDINGTTTLNNPGVLNFKVITIPSI